ncbi:MAG: type I pantothenate kinase [Bryobacteraceae bacterium]
MERNPRKGSGTATPAPISRYIDFNREQWKALRSNTPLLLNEEELGSLRGINEQVSLLEVEEIYVPLSRLLNLHVAAVQHLYRARREFMGSPPASKVPYIIAVAGSVAVGKSTFSRVLQACLARWIDHPRVDLVTTDGFLYPNRVLEERGLMNRKGFPDSYDQRRLLHFLADIKAGVPVVAAPVYSHLHYDIVPDAIQEVRQPDILIMEGLNLLQSPGEDARGASRVFVSDLFDFSIYLDTDEQTIERWYVERFLRLRETVFREQASYFHRYVQLSETEARETARRIWEEINLLNLRENIRPTRERAHLILEKGDDHLTERVKLRRV